MFKIQRVNIDGFWSRLDANCEFSADVNVLIGRNGTGKTTFMNILHAVLTVNIEELIVSEFDSVEIHLAKGKAKRTVKAWRRADDNFPFLSLEYQISQTKYKLRMISPDERRIPPSVRRRMLADSAEIKRSLSGLVAVSSISVYRLRSGDDYEIRDRYGTRIVPPVDFRLSELLDQLTRYQLEIYQQARKIATNLQKAVLVSILFSKEDSGEIAYRSNFDKEQEREKLTAAYSQLGAFDSSVQKKIDFHVTAVDETLTSQEKGGGETIDIGSLEAFRKTSKIIELSLEAEKKTAAIYSQLELFVSTVKEFILDKDFSVHSGSLEVSNSQGKIEYSKLSSGEKQLLILLIEALLQELKPHVFLADEPELSLHIDWQKKVIPAVKKLNPNAQVIVATHSPEVASEYRDSIIDMEEIVSD